MCNCTEEKCYPYPDNSSEVLKFIRRRFPGQHDIWLAGNCFYFAKILEARFNGKIYYDVIYGHFVTLIDGTYWDYRGVYDRTDMILVAWDEFKDYDALQYEHIIRDCIY